MHIQRDNRGWRHDLSDQEILNKVFDFYYLLSTNDHPILNQIKELTLCNYKVRAKFIWEGFNGDQITCNGRKLVYRINKFSTIQYAHDVKLIEGTPLKASGSNNYPTVRFDKDYCVLEFISDGLPILDPVNGWRIQIIEMIKI